VTPRPQPAVTSATSPPVAVAVPQLVEEEEWAALLKQMQAPPRSAGEVTETLPKHSSAVLVVLGNVGTTRRCHGVPCERWVARHLIKALTGSQSKSSSVVQASLQLSPGSPLQSQ